MSATKRYRELAERAESHGFHIHISILPGPPVVGDRLVVKRLSNTSHGDLAGSLDDIETYFDAIEAAKVIKPELDAFDERWSS